MTHSREIFQMENNQSTFDKDHGFYVSRKQAFLYSLLLVAGVIGAGWLSHYFTFKSLKKEGLAEADGKESHSKPGDHFWTDEPKEKMKNFRLPKSLVPHFYEIKLIPFVFENNFTFNGQVRIIVNATQDTSNVTLHAVDLLVDSESVKVAEDEGKEVPVDGLSNDTDRQFFVVHTKKNLIAGRQYEISMKFIGLLQDELRGFYRSSYKVGKLTRWIATTQFQATDARRAFPCFDEPALKAKFKLFIGRPRNMSSISNMPQSNTGEPVAGLSDYVWDEYQESVPMSTYLVAFVVSDFSHMTSGDKFSVWARTSAITQAQYSLEIGPKLLKYYKNYFGIDFPLPKVDMIALPDFAIGAMENWGLITYRESAMLYDQNVSSSQSKEGVITVVAHELAHQWFGNLVTPSWWSDLWLNEGFATYLEYLGLEAIEPYWKVTQLMSRQVQSVFVLDALRTSHQISVEVHHPDEISEIFDTISYSKGASIIRMMAHFLTTTVFKRGLFTYLKRHEFGNSEQDDLWAALTEQAQKDLVLPKNTSVKTIMDTWTLQTGFPVITVTRNYEQRSAVVNQERFLLYKSTSKLLSKGSETKVLWWVPITYTTSEKLDFNSTNPSHWMKKEKEIVISDMPSDANWVIFNIQQTGLYRVNYDEGNWKLLISYLENSSSFENLNPINRAQLIDDALNLARAGLLSYDIAMNVTRYLFNELEFLPWESAVNAFQYLHDMLIKTPGFGTFKKYLLKIIQNLYDHVGFQNNPNDPQFTKYKRMLVLSLACYHGHRDCVNNSVTQFRSWKQMSEPDANNPIPPDFKSTVYCAAVRFGDENDWNFVWERFKNANVASERSLLLTTLGCSRELWILSRMLDWALTENSGIRKQDVATVFSIVSATPAGQSLVFDLISERWDQLKSYVGNSPFGLSTIVKSGFATINSKSQLKQLMEFAKKRRHELGSASRTVEQAVEEAEANILWMNNNYNSMVRWLSDALG